MDQNLDMLLLLVVLLQTLVILSSNSQANGMKFFEMENLPKSWKGLDPCGNNWEGIECTNSNVTSIRLSSMGLKGRLTEDIERLSELQVLDLSYNKQLTGPLPQSVGNLKKLTNLIMAGCGFSGEIPGTVGSLSELIALSLNSNELDGNIPATIGYLSRLIWLDLTDNNLMGPIPVSHGTTPGLDMLHRCRHFHLGKNKLAGPIPDKLFSADMNLIHVFMDNNKLSSTIPSTFGLVQSLEVINLNNNSFEQSEFPSWFSNLSSLRMLQMEDTQLEGKIPADLFRLPNLEIVRLKNNNLNGKLDINISENTHLKLIDLERNDIMEFDYSDKLRNVQIILVGNTICAQSGPQPSYCNDTLTQSTSAYVTERTCISGLCSTYQISSPNCACAIPYSGTLTFIVSSLRDIHDKSFYKELETSLMKFFHDYSFPVESISLSNPTKTSSGDLLIRLDIFPIGRDHFNRTEILNLGSALANQTVDPLVFGPYYFLGEEYAYYVGDKGSTKSKQTFSFGLIVAAVVGCALILILLLGGIYAFLRMRRAERAAELSYTLPWVSSKSHARIPQPKTSRLFSFKELKKYTQNFSEENEIGCGGYGKVYLGTLPSGELVAVKRAKAESKQGMIEFTTEIELLSRLHHKNLVSLAGFCFEQGEQMLIYEYVPNGTLKDSLSGKSGIRLDWMNRLTVALDIAKGIAYLHESADPPIIHRDIKSTNILLGDRLVAKVADFGLSKLMGDDGKDHVTTQVKGTAGYLDPDYYMTQHLTDKSDVYSFGVLMLELITARKPIERGKFIVKEVEASMDKSKELYNLHEILDPEIGSITELHGFKRFVELAMWCVENAGVDRPTMSQVVKEIETIFQIIDSDE